MLVLLLFKYLNDKGSVILHKNFTLNENTGSINGCYKYIMRFVPIPLAHVSTKSGYQATYLCGKKEIMVQIWIKHDEKNSFKVTHQQND